MEVWSKKCHNYLFGKPFTINSDHKPLLTLLNEAKAIPTMVSGRIQRWAILLSAYEYKFKFKPGKEIANADVISRLPLKVREEEIPEPAEIVFNIKKLDEMIARKELVSATSEDTMILLHEGHPGIVRKKSLARSYFWWSTMDLDIEAVVKECVGCQENSNKPNMNEYSSWIEPTQPWQRVHIDFAGPFLGKMFFCDGGCLFKMDGGFSHARYF